MLSDCALEHASIHTGLVGEKRSWSKLHPALSHAAAEYVDDARELQILQVFHHRVRDQCRANFAPVGLNEDERLHALAAEALEREAFAWDVL